MPACLIWFFNGRQERRELGDKEVLIGRQAGADVVLPDAFISRRHAIVRKVGDGYVLEDLKSAHGTSVNGERVATKLLSNGDRIELADGRLELQFWAEEPGSAAATFDRMTGLEKISCILDFQYQHGGQLSPEIMFQQILRSAVTISGAERGFIMLRQAGGIEYVVGLDQVGRILSQADFETSRSVVDRVTADGQPVFMIQGIDEEFERQESIIRMNLRAVACMPLSWIAARGQSEEVNGILYLDSTNPMHPLSGLDKKILTKLAEQASGVFEKLEHLRGIQERRELERELALAEETQRSLLPRSLPEFGGFQVHAYSQPTRHVGGDFYAFPCPTEQRLTGVLADVSGKGLSAALLASLLLGALEMECRAERPPEEIICRLNLFLCQKTASNRFATVFFFKTDSKGDGVYISAGHNPAYLVRSGGKIETLSSEGLILGAFEFATYKANPFRLGHGDGLLIYSDGLTDAQNPDGDMFGDDRLLEATQFAAQQSQVPLHEHVLQTVRDFTQGIAQTDDITLLFLQRTS